MAPLRSCHIIWCRASKQSLCRCNCKRVDAYDSLSMNWYANMGLRQARRIVVSVIGFTVLVVGVALLVLPGPAMLVIPIGLAILATEFIWARRLLRRVRRAAGNVHQAAKRRFSGWRTRKEPQIDCARSK